MSHIEKYKNDFILLAEAGFIAINQCDEDAAIKLFKAAELLDKNNQLSKIGFGYLHLHKMELELAIKAFNEVLKKEPDNEMAKALMGISMTFTTNQVGKGEKILFDIQQSTDDKEVKQLSETAIDFVDTFIKKEPTPVEGKHKK